MTANLTSPRPDIAYLRRVPKRTDKQPVVVQVAPTSLSFSSTSQKPANIPAEIEIPSLPSLADRVRLDSKNPVVQANARKSAIDHSLLLAVVLIPGTSILRQIVKMSLVTDQI